MYRIIRASSNFSLLIVVTPADKDTDPAKLEYYRFATWQIGDAPANHFHPITHSTALNYFGGQADGLGWGKYLDAPFPDFETILNWRKEQLNIEETFRTKQTSMVGVIAEIERQLMENPKKQYLLRHPVVTFTCTSGASGQGAIVSFHPKPSEAASGHNLIVASE